MRFPFRCIICGGEGKIQEGEDGTSVAFGEKTCHACGGTGVIWSPDKNSTPYCTQPGRPPSIWVGSPPDN